MTILGHGAVASPPKTTKEANNIEMGRTHLRSPACWGCASSLVPKECESVSLALQRSGVRFGIRRRRTLYWLHSICWGLPEKNWLENHGRIYRDLRVAAFHVHLGGGFGAMLGNCLAMFGGISLSVYKISAQNCKTAAKKHQQSPNFSLDANLTPTAN